MILDGTIGERAHLLVIYSRNGHHIGQKHRLETAASPITLGRSLGSALTFDADGISRKHARLECRAGEWWIVDEGSTNGTWVNDQQIVEVALRDGDRVRIGDVIVKVVGDGESPIFDGDGHFDGHLLVDGLTQLANKRSVLHSIERELRHPERAWRPLSLAIFDIDWFKRVNDAVGHQAGDAVIRAVASQLRLAAGSGDIAARYAGEEFVWLMVGAEIDAAMQCAEKLRAAIESQAITYEQHSISVTVSGGVVQADERVVLAEDFVRLADEKLYEAKRAGRNRVCRS